MNNFFSPARTAKLIRKDVLSEYKSLLVWLASAAGVMIVISFLNILFFKLNGGNQNSKEFHYIIFVLLLFPGGYILTSNMFRDVHDKSKNIYWLMLPGSTFEKMLSRLLISTVVYAFLLILVYPLLALVSEMFNQIVFGMRHEFFNPFIPRVLEMIPYYLVTQSLFFAGAVFFRKHHFAKTLLFMAVFNIVLTILSVILLRIIIGPDFRDMRGINFNESSFMMYAGHSMDSLTGFAKFMATAMKVLFWGVIAPFFYVLSYFKLSEKEVRDGV